MMALRLLREIIVLPSIRIVLVNTSHPGNIGAAARAMKTMGLSQLYLVEPLFFPHSKANEMAVSAVDLLENAVVVKDLSEAIADCEWVVGTSARSRTIPWPLLTPRELAEKTVLERPAASIAVVFGREQSGLTNEELQCCHAHVHIPSHPNYSSLNIAAAVQIICYELRVASLGNTPPVEPTWDYPYVSMKEMHLFYEQLERVLIKIDFLNPDVPRQLMPRLQRLFNRVRLDMMEMNILRGILSSVEKLK